MVDVGKGGTVRHDTHAAVLGHSIGFSRLQREVSGSARNKAGDECAAERERERERDRCCGSILWAVLHQLLALTLSGPSHFLHPLALPYPTTPLLTHLIRSPHFDIRWSEKAVFSNAEGLGNSCSIMRCVMKATFRHRLKFVFFSTEQGGAVVTHWTRIREDPDSIPSLAILISVFHVFPKSLQANACWDESQIKDTADSFPFLTLSIFLVQLAPSLMTTLVLVTSLTFRGGECRQRRWRKQPIRGKNIGKKKSNYCLNFFPPLAVSRRVVLLRRALAVTLSLIAAFRFTAPSRRAFVKRALSNAPDKIDVKLVYTEVDFAAGWQFIRHILDTSETIAELQERSSECHTARRVLYAPPSAETSPGRRDTEARSTTTKFGGALCDRRKPSYYSVDLCPVVTEHCKREEQSDMHLVYWTNNGNPRVEQPDQEQCQPDNSPDSPTKVDSISTFVGRRTGRPRLAKTLSRVVGRESVVPRSLRSVIYIPVFLPIVVRRAGPALKRSTYEVDIWKMLHSPYFQYAQQTCSALQSSLSSVCSASLGVSAELVCVVQLRAPYPLRGSYSTIAYLVAQEHGQLTFP
ncbi:hypothetical protein PR048_009734 [Dryococelus australis]|uniref:Uncharacterized protein n=1 Tax=Dryococelus australis TaxID=614101 RepID=A0ABQ9I1I4_9NEOP|nr:hypothetical protein PR048_009734 [Dryococelus australis]